MSRLRYQNPVATAGDFADPFVLRFNGRYYLYATNADLRCWSSDDLVHWTLEGPTIAPDLFPGLVPFAPEVVYWNGWFYLYTSPSGHGHFVLRSASPTGPFEAVTGNVGHDIDGHVLIDDDGRWYFYWAGHEGIWACEMPTPATFGEPVLTGAFMHGWTEGPFVTKRDGRYHMTLTGNHYLSPGYRIDAVVSDDPMRGYLADPLNPILLNTVGPGIGLGHSSSVIGPDLVSTYLAYHNLNADETRDLNLARQVWNRDALEVLGPAPEGTVALPDARVAWADPGAVSQWEVDGDLDVDGHWAHLRGAAVWQRATVGGHVTAEVTLAGSAEGAYGIRLLGHSVLELSVETAERAIVLAREGEVLASAQLPGGFVHEAAHAFRIQVADTQLRLHVDGREQLVADVGALGPVRIGAFAAHGARLGTCVFTDSTESRAAVVAAKPVPGRFWAAVADGSPVLANRELGGVHFAVLVVGPTAVEYRCSVATSGAYAVYLTGDFQSGDRVGVRASGGGEVIVGAAEATRVLQLPLTLGHGDGALSVRAIAGAPRIALIETTPAGPEPGPIEVQDRIQGFGKRVLGDGAWHDFDLEAVVEVRPGSAKGHGDVLLRASQLSEGGDRADDTRLGIDFLLGYSVQVGADGVALARHDYDTTVLARWAASLAGPVDLRVRARGATFSVWVGKELVIEHDDPLPHLVGGLGLRAVGAELSGRLTAKPI